MDKATDSSKDFGNISSASGLQEYKGAKIGWVSEKVLYDTNENYTFKAMESGKVNVKWTYDSSSYITKTVKIFEGSDSNSLSKSPVKLYEKTIAGTTDGEWSFSFDAKTGDYYKISFYGDKNDIGWFGSYKYNLAFQLVGSSSPPSTNTTVPTQTSTVNTNTNTTATSSPSTDKITNGTSGNDTIFGTSINDIIYGNNGDDFLDGGYGDDTLSGNVGADVIWGHEGNDFISGGKGMDWIFAGSGNDTIYGNMDNDTINAEDGNDTIRGGWGYDTINGGNGDDVIYGMDERDILTGDSGNDKFIYTMAIHSTYNYMDSIMDFVVGTDKIDLTAFKAVKSPASSTIQSKIDAAGLGPLVSAMDTCAANNFVDGGVCIFDWRGTKYLYRETSGANTTYNSNDLLIEIKGTTTGISFDNSILS